MKYIIKICSLFMVIVFTLQCFNIGTLAAVRNLTILENVESTDINNDLSLSELEKINKIKADERFVNEKSLIASEIVNLRSENSKYFLHKDGTYTVAMYSNPIHFLQNGKWEEINTSLKLNRNNVDENGKYMYSPENMGLDICFPQGLNNNQKIEIGKNDFKIEFGLQMDSLEIEPIKEEQDISSDIKLPTQTCIINNDIDEKNSNTSSASDEKDVIQSKNEEKMKMNHLSSSVTYKNVLLNTDFEYIISSNKIKENIVINSKQKNYIYNFDINLKGLTPQHQTDGSILLVDENDETATVFTIEAPFMIDANSNICTDVTMSLKNNVLTVFADSTWINSSERKFPIKIDPTISMNASAIYDAYVSSLFKSKNMRGNSHLLGCYIAGITRDYYKFTLPQLPDGSVVTNAEFQIKQERCNSNEASQIYAFDLTGLDSWSYTGVTWENQPVSNKENGALTDGIKIIDYCATNSASDYVYEFNITKTVKNWYENNNNNGIMLAVNDESKVSNYSLYSTTSDFGSCRPTLTVEYCYNSGLEDYWAYETIDLGRSGIEYVNTYNGSLTYIADDINMNGNILPIKISHVYNNNIDFSVYQNCYSGMNVGYGCNLNIQKMLIPIYSNDPLYKSSYRYKLYDGDGTVHYFIDNGMGKGIHDEYNEDIIVSHAGMNMVVSNLNGTKEYYNGSGQLIRIVDSNENSQEINIVDDRIVSISNSVKGSENSIYSVDFTYDDSNNLISLTDPAARKIAFSYIKRRTNMYLSAITYPDNKKTELKYTGSASLLLNKVISFEGSYTNIKYKTTKGCGQRVNSIYYYDKNGTEINHYVFQYTQQNESGIATGNTLVTSKNGKSNRYLFDQYGRVRNVTNQDGQTQYMVFNNFSEDDRNNFNLLRDNSEMQTISNNMLKGHGFESEGWRVKKSSNDCLSSLTKEESSNGKKSYKVELKNLSDSVEVIQSIGSKASSIYTISVDINIPADLEMTEESGVTFGLEYTYNGKKVFDHGEWLGSKKTDGWERFSHTIHMPDDAIRACSVVLKMTNAKGVVYFDNVQIEKSGGSRYYNLIENSDFFNANGATTEPKGIIPYGWKALNMNTGDGVQVRGDRKYFMMTGSCDKEKVVYQNVPVNADVGETLIIGGRAAAYATMDKANKNKFCIQAVLYSTENDPNPEVIEINFDRSINMEHQVAATYYTLKKKCDHIIYRFLYYSHVDCATLDDAFIYVGSFGEHYDYDEGNLTSVSNDEGKSVNYEYDNNGDIKTLSQKFGQSVSGDLSTQSVDTASVSETNDSISYEYDENHNVIKATSKRGKKVEYEYLNGQVITQTMTEETETGETLKTITQRYTYIKEGSFLKTYTDENGNVTTYTYDNNDNPLKGLVVRIDYPKGNYVNYTYNENTDELVSTSGNIDSTSSAITNIMYNNSLPTAILKNGMDYSYEYDSQHRITASKIGQINMVTYSYDDHDRLLQQTFANGASYTPVYDNRDRLSEDIWDDNSLAKYYYNENDRLSEFKDNITGVNYRYDYAFYGMLHRIVGSDGTKTLYDYDLSGNKSKVDFYIGDENVYSARFYPNYSGDIEDVVLRSFNNTKLHYNYDGFNRLIGNSFGEYSREITYCDKENASSNLVSKYVNVMPHSNTTQTFNYNYDPNGNVIEIVEENRNIETEGDNNIEQSTITTAYSYDDLDRLIEENIDGHKIKYDYDLGGNLTSTRENGIISHSYSYANSGWTDLLISVDGKAITYDQIGNPLTYDGRTFNWQHGTQLTSIVGDNINEAYTYDATGHRISKVTKDFETSEYETTRYIYSGDLLIRQIVGNNIMDFQYDYNNDVIGFKYNGTPYFYLKNLYGDVVAIASENGDIVAEYRYDAYGNTRYSSGNEIKDINPIRYRSYYQDASTGYYFLQTRYYNPEWRRFISADSVFITGNMLTGSNMYAYCNDNPVAFSDSQGTEATLAEKILGNAVRLASKAVSKRLTNETNAFFAVANNVALPLVKILGGSQFAESTLAKLAVSNPELIKQVVEYIYTGTETDDVPTGLRHFMPVNMSGGAPWAGYLLGFEKSTYVDKDNYSVKAANKVLSNRFLNKIPFVVNRCNAIIKEHTFTNYTTVEGKYMWQSQVGYSGLYDLAFSMGGPIKRLMYRFTATINSKPRYYVIWCWKADYWNLGAGAEIGIYYTDSAEDKEKNFYNINTDLNLHVRMDIDYGINTPITLKHLNDFHQTNWWVTSFTPEIQFANIDLLRVKLKVRFVDKMIDGFNSYKLMKPFYQEWSTHSENENSEDISDEEKAWENIKMLGYTYRTPLSGHTACHRCQESIHPSLCTCSCSLQKLSGTYPDCRKYSCKEYTEKCTSNDIGCLHYNDPDNGFQFEISY